MLSLEAFPTCFPTYHLALWWLRRPGPSFPHPVTRCHNQIHKRRGDAPQGTCQPREKERNCRGHLEKLKSIYPRVHVDFGEWINTEQTVNKGDQSQMLSLLEVPVWRIWVKLYFPRFRERSSGGRSEFKREPWPFSAESPTSMCFPVGKPRRTSLHFQEITI